MKKKEYEDPMMFSIEFNERQLEVLIKALDLYSRIGMGQVSAIYSELFHFPELLEKVQNLLNHYKSDSNHGIGHEKVPKNYKVAHDMWQVMKNRNSKERNSKEPELIPLYGGEGPVEIKRMETEGERILKKGF